MATTNSEDRKRKIDTDRCQWHTYPFTDDPKCPKKALPTSDLCKAHVDLRKLYEQAAKTGAKVSKNKDGSYTVSGGSKPRQTRGKNAKEVAVLRAYINKAGPDAIKRFGAQLGLANTLAIEMDNGGTSNANVYKSLLQDIYTRLDRIYGTQNLDIITRMEMMIDENAKKRQEKGWD